MKRSYGPRKLTKADHMLRLHQWLYGAREAAVMETSLETVRGWYSALKPADVDAAVMARRAEIGGRDV